MEATSNKPKKKKFVIKKLSKLEQYEKQLTDIEKIALEIAKEQLQSSYDMELSIGYLEWVKKQPQIPEKN